jgi:hypothetical protein
MVKAAGIQNVPANEKRLPKAMERRSALDEVFRNLC